MREGDGHRDLGFGLMKNFTSPLLLQYNAIINKSPCQVAKKSCQNSMIMSHFDSLEMSPDRALEVSAMEEIIMSNPICSVVSYTWKLAFCKS